MEWILAVAVSIVAGYVGSRIARRARRAPAPQAEVVLPVPPVSPSEPLVTFVPAQTQTTVLPRAATTDAQRAPTQNGLLPPMAPRVVAAPVASNGIPTPVPDVATVRYERLDIEASDDDDEYTQAGSIPSPDDVPWAVGSAPNYKHHYERDDAIRRTVELARMRNALEHLTLEDAGTRPFERAPSTERRTEDSVVAPPSPRDTWPN